LLFGGSESNRDRRDGIVLCQARELLPLGREDAAHLRAGQRLQRVAVGGSACAGHGVTSRGSCGCRRFWPGMVHQRESTICPRDERLLGSASSSPRERHNTSISLDRHSRQPLWRSARSDGHLADLVQELDIFSATRGEALPEASSTRIQPILINSRAQTEGASQTIELLLPNYTTGHFRKKHAAW
jgi:hypothetical protein